MAANKFATMLHKNSHSMAVILVYTFLEWILIAILLLNGSVSYLIGKFADFFGLKRPCFFCSRIDRLFEPDQGRSAYGNLFCDTHAAEVSRLGYCSKHRRLAQASAMCEDCSSSVAEEDRTVALLSWMKGSEEGEKDPRCSCCDVILESGVYSPYFLLKPSSWGILEYDHRGNLVGEVAEDSERTHKDAIFDQERVKVAIFDPKRVEKMKMASRVVADTADEREENKDDMGPLISEPEAEQDGEALIQFSETCLLVEDASLDVLNQRVEKVTDEERLVPVELIDSMTMTKSSTSCKIGGEDDRELGNDLIEEVTRSLESRSISEEKLALSSSVEKADIFEMCSSVPPAGELGWERSNHRQCAVPLEIPTPLDPQDNVDVEVEPLVAIEDFCEPQEDVKMIDMEANCEISIGSEIRDQKHICEAHLHDLIPLSVGVGNQCSEIYNEATDKDQAAEIEPVVTMAQSVNHLSIFVEFNEVEDGRAPETPTYIDVHKRFMHERRESGTESVDGSIASEIEGGEPLTIDRLTSALKAERKALSALYAELEEERSASAVAANQTMAMISRLQEEKAAMQMEALQYQRMMEEQSEYDQEALQFLNEQMMKREKEKQDLEKELEVYRKKVLLYEAKERRRLTRNNQTSGRRGTSSASSGADDSDHLPFNLHEGNECAYDIDERNQNTATDAVFNLETNHCTTKHLIALDETLTDFEKERFSILEQLKALEEKLFTLDDEVSNNVNAMEHLSEENGHAPNGTYESSDANGCYDDSNTKDHHHYEQRSTSCRRKRLIPLFDAVGIENEGEVFTKQEATDASPDSMSKLSKEQMKVAIAEEVDNVYERLQALEADREFLKHCISSLKKGDKGMDLLQGILQLLRDLRSVELRVRNADDAPALL